MSFYQKNCGGQGRPLRVEKSDSLSLSDFNARAICPHLVCACGIVWYTLGSFGIARAFFRADVRFALIVQRTFWLCALVIEGSALKLPQAFRERLEPKLFSLAFLPQICHNQKETAEAVSFI
jgi:hypothetical protein